MLLIDEPKTCPADADALIEEARKRTRKRRRRIAVVLLATAAGFAYVLGGGGGGSGRTALSGHGAPLPGGAARGTAQSIAASRLTVLPYISDFGLLAPGEGWAANGVSVYFTGDAGAHWKTLDVPKLTGGDVIANLFAATSVGRDDIFLSYDTGRSYGSCTHSTGAGPSEDAYTVGSVARSNNRGRTWQLSTLPGCAIATSLSFVSARTGFAIDRSAYQPPRGRLLATRDGGQTWRTIAATPFVGPIDFTTASDGWGVAGPVGSVSTGALPATVTGALYHTTNGGRSWQRQSICTTTSTSGTFTDCGTPRFFARRIGVLPVTTVDRHAGRAALTVERTTNGGRTWSGTRLPSVPATPSMRYGSGQAGKFVAISATNWIALVGPRLYETTDAGSRWTTLAPKPDLPASRVFELDFTSARAGWVLADPVSSDANAQPIFDYTINSGRTWHPLARQ